MSDLADQLWEEYLQAAERLRRHKRTMRENHCDEQDSPCWMDFVDGQNKLSASEMCDQCLIRQVAYHFRGDAVKQLANARRAIEKYAKIMRNKGES